MRSFIATLLCILVIPMLIWGGYYMHREQIVVHISAAETHCTSSDTGSDCRYLIYTDEGVFENTDDWLLFKLSSSDYQSEFLKKGKFELDVVGYRLPLFSVYPNVINYKKLPDYEAK